MAENNAINKWTDYLWINKVSGDPFVNFQINSVDKHVMGVDDSDADSFKINLAGASPSAGTNAWKMDTSGQRIMPVQPAFNAYLNGDTLNVTGDYTIWTLINVTEVFDQNADLNNATGIFTAPVTGRYHLYGQFQTLVDAARIDFTARIYTSNRTYSHNTGASKSSSNEANYKLSALADMDAADTAYIAVETGGGGAGKVDDADGDAAISQVYYHGYLEC